MPWVDTIEVEREKAGYSLPFLRGDITTDSPNPSDAAMYDDSTRGSQHQILQKDRSPGGMIDSTIANKSRSTIPHFP